MRAASHEGLVAGDDVTWRSTYVGAARIELARPIDRASFDAERSPDVVLVVDGARITAFVTNDALPYVLVVTHAPRVHDGDAEILAPPLARGDLVQRVDLAGDGELRFAPEEPRFEHHVGYWTTHDVSESAKVACDGALYTRPALDESPLYVGAEGTTHALRGHVTTAADRARGGAIAATLLAFIVLALLALAYRRLTGRARVEQAEAALREEYERDARG